jgi:hypothetical protein
MLINGYTSARSGLMPTILILLAASCLAAAAADSPISPEIRPERFYPSEMAISSWAATNSFGGSRTEAYRHNDQEVLVAFRHFTSTAPSADISFFIQDRDRWKLVLWYPLRGEESKIEKKKDGLQVIAYDYKRKKWVKRLFVPYDALFPALFKLGDL